MSSVIAGKLNSSLERRLQSANLVGSSDVWIDPLTAEMVVALSASVYGVYRGRLVFKRPTSWWQRFKLDVFPNWLLRIAPVEFEVVEYRLDQIFSKLRYGEFGSEIRVTEFKRDVLEDNFVDFSAREVWIEEYFGE